MALETELKLKIEDHQAIKEKFSDLPIVQVRTFEENLLLDHKNRLKSADCALRLRKCGNTNTLTYKGPKLDSGNIQTRQEMETVVEDFGNALKIFEALGFKVQFRYQKYRTVWRMTPQTLLMLDQTPIGWFLEVEGPPEQIEQAVKTYALGELEIIGDSYPVYYQKQFATQEKLNMIF